MKHLTDLWAGTVAAIGSVLGVVVGHLKWRSRSAAVDHWGVHSSALWVSAMEALTLVRPDGLLIWRENRKSGELLRYAGQQHLINNAPTRSEKDVGAIIPNLLTAERSILCIDPRGENARVAFRARERRRVYVLDPFGVSASRPAPTFPVCPK